MTENYKDICHVFYDGATCVAFEFFSPSQVFYNNTPLLGQEHNNVESLFNILEGYESNSDGFNVYNKDLGFYVPFDVIESVYISRKEYSEEQYNFYMKKYAEKYGV